MSKKKLVVLSGAGVSAESGIRTFRDSDGLWENYKVEDVASIDGWYRDRKLVLDFYNARRKDLEKAEPNLAHKLIAELEKDFDVTVITQNIDNLHEKGGSTNIIHLHGEATKVRGDGADYNDNFEVGYKPIRLGDTDSRGRQLRPHIVWFGEAVPMIEKAAEEVSKADILLIIGTSLVVYPAAGLVGYVRAGVPVYLIDPHPMDVHYCQFEQIQDVATRGMKKFVEMIKDKK
ncbi:MAG: NAD-dependent deacylase [Bacteroidales bacterium]|nr:NAD-dependent deacylase [Bacteroidales bacterium]